MTFFPRSAVVGPYVVSFHGAPDTSPDAIN